MKRAFNEFIAGGNYGWEFSLVKQKDLEWAKNYIKSIPEILTNQTHCGDCTKVPCTCDFCLLQNYLDDYEMYCLHEDEFNAKYNDEFKKRWNNIGKKNE